MAGELSPAKRRLLARLAKGGGKGLAGIARQPGDGPFPLSYAQERVWFTGRLAEGIPLFNLLGAVRPATPHDPADLERELARVAARHDVLRTHVRVVDDVPQLVVEPSVPIRVPVHDCSAMDPAAPADPAGLAGPADIDELAMRKAMEIGLRPYRLDTPPLWRLELVRLPDGGQLLVFGTHHIVMDATAVMLFISDVFGLAPVPEPPIRYADFAAWQKAAVEGGGTAADLAYWRRQLADLPPPLALPTDRPRPAQRSLRGATVTCEIPAGLIERVRQLGQREGATRYMIFFAAFTVLLRACTGAEDILVGSSVSGRTRPELQSMLGMFVNMVVLRTSLAGRPTFRELIARVRQTASDGFGRQNVPFEKLVRELRLGGSRSHPPLAQVGFNMPTQEFAVPAVTALDIPFSPRGAQLDLTAHVMPHSIEGDLRLQFEYAADLFDEATARRTMRRYLTALDRLTADPERPVDEVSLLEPDERELLLAGRGPRPTWSPATAPDQPLGCLIEAQAKRQPRATAVVCQGGDLSYGELDARSNGLARRLAELGVGPDTPVAVCLRRGPDLPAALLAVWKAGGAYLPIDPDQPAARSHMIMEDAAPPVLITHTEVARPPLRDGVATVFVDACPPAEAGPRARVGPDHAAYVIYTSGSTGRPKGVAVTHGGIANRVLWAVRRFGFGPADRVLQKTRLTFDAASWEIFAPLVSGGAMVMAPPGVEADPEAMIAAVAEHRVTVLQAVPSVLRLLVGVPDWSGCRDLRLLFSAGEPLHAELCARVRERVGARAGVQADVEIVNTYGPTECAVDVTAARQDPGQRDGAVPIGRPIDNIRAHVLAPDGEPVPVGVPGELHIAGVGVGRGYLGRPDLTAAAFVPDPHGPPGSRRYRTGDLVRWRADGELEFLGRLDHQVKVNGVRVEPGEVEAAVTGCPEVRAAAVAAHPDAHGEARLVAYVVGDVRDDELRERLRERLPGPMIPGRVIRLDALPLTPSGKVDRAALPAPDPAARPDGADHTPPRGHIEAVIASIWSQLLGVEQVGAHDDFFGLGGHSLLLTRLLGALREQLDLDVGLRELFAASTVAAQARLAAERRAASAPVRRADRRQPLPLSSGQRRLWFLDQLDPGSSQYVIPHVFELHGDLDPAALRRALTEVVGTHEVLRTRYQAVDGEPVQVVDPPAEVPLATHDVSAADDPEAAAHELAAAEICQPFDLAAGPVVRCSVIRMAPARHLAVLAVHHIAFDGWSSAVLGRDLRAGYAAALAGRPSGLSPGEIQYGDYAAWQQERLRGPELADQVRHWRAQLTGLTPVELPTDRPRPATWSGRGDVRAFTVPADVARRLLRLGREQHATPFMTALAAFDILLARHTGQTDLAVGTPVAGRTRPEVEGLVGFFANTLVLRADLAGEPSFREVLRRVRRVCLDAFAHQDLPFEQLVDELNPERDLSRNPLFEIMFEWAAADEAVDLPGLRTEPPCQMSWRTAKFDLTFGVSEQADGSLSGYVEYAADLFDPAAVDRIAAHYVQVLEQVVEAPDMPLGRLPLLRADERRTALGECQSFDPPQVDACVHELIARQAARTPDATAVAQGERALSYAELDARANQLAAELRARGVTAETPAAVLMRRCPEVVVALLGVLKAGGVYVPLDPDGPAERLSTLLRDVAPRTVLTTPELAGGLPEIAAPVLVVADDPDAVAAEPPTPVATPDCLAYVIHTSGSTGRPKGVMIDHRAYVSHCQVISETYGIGPDSRVALLSSLVFDVAMDQMAATLLRGGTIVAADPGLSAGSEVVDGIGAQGVTVMETVPAYYRDMISGVAPADPRLRGLRVINLSSDVITYDDARRWHEADLPGRFLCTYGPTEATVTCMAYEPSAAEAVAERPEQAVPIGWPVRDTRAYVVDRWLNPAPVGVPGELWLGGPRLARGYLGRPDLTARQFVPDPFGDVPGARLYRTGDLARRRADGAIEFLGRLDTQVKVRGFRIELGEIEATLAGSPGVAAAAVVARRGCDGDAELAAYLVPGPGVDLDPWAVRDHVRERLPDYMIPAHWVTLDELPLTASGKPDRGALPAPGEPSRLRRAYTPPRTDAEQQVAAIWGELLGVAQVGAHDDFFELGGHSLLATRVLIRLQQGFDVELPLRRLFEATTVAELAVVLEETIEAQIAEFSDEEVAALLSEG